MQQFASKISNKTVEFCACELRFGKQKEYIYLLMHGPYYL